MSWLVSRGWAALLLLATLLAGCPGKKCGPENCDGCCDADGRCVAEVSKAACGASGSACDVCGATSACVSGRCVGIDGQDAGATCQRQGKCARADGTCGDACPTGCCAADDPNGRCVAGGTSQAACGSGARACVECGASQSCVPVSNGGACVAAVSEVMKPCTQDADCASIPSGICKLTTSSGSGPYPGGYCTSRCGRAGQPVCPADSACVGGADALGESDPFCWKRCDTDLECRGGTEYLCYQVGEGESACWLAPRSAPQGVPGSSCTADSQCGPPPDFAPWCLLEQTDAGTRTGFLGGACTVDCSFTLDEQCGPSGICVPFTINGSQSLLCQQACTGLFQGQGDCRQGYVCRAFALPDGGYEPRGYCARSCNNPVGDGSQKVGCPTGTTCATNGYCCTADGGCY